MYIGYGFLKLVIWQFHISLKICAIFGILSFSRPIYFSRKIDVLLVIQKTKVHHIVMVSFSAILVSDVDANFACIMCFIYLFPYYASAPIGRRL